MAETEQVGSANTQESQSAQEELEQTQTKDTVAYDTYKRTVSEVKKLKALLSEKEAKEADEKQKALAEQGQWKSIAETTKKQLEETQSKLHNQSKMIEDSIKMQAFLKQLPGTVDEDYWALVNLEEIPLSPDTNKPDPVALESYAKNWIQKHSRLINKPATAKVPSEAPKLTTSTDATNLSIAEMARKLASLNNAKQ